MSKAAQEQRCLSQPGHTAAKGPAAILGLSPGAETQAGRGDTREGSPVTRETRTITGDICSGGQSLLGRHTPRWAAADVRVTRTNTEPDGHTARTRQHFVLRSDPRITRRRDPPARNV